MTLPFYRYFFCRGGPRGIDHRQCPFTKLLSEGHMSWQMQGLAISWVHSKKWPPNRGSQGSCFGQQRLTWIPVWRKTPALPRKVAVKKMLILDGEQKESFEKEAQIMMLNWTLLSWVRSRGGMARLKVGPSGPWFGSPSSPTGGVRKSQVCAFSRWIRYFFLP